MSRIRVDTKKGPSMSIKNAAGATLTRTQFLALTTTDPAPEAVYTLTAPVYQSYPLPGERDFERGQRRLFKAGDKVRLSEVNALFKTATVTAVTPTTGAAAGNTAVTITGTNLEGVSGVTFGGTAATQVKVVSATKVTCRTPAKAAGAHAVVVLDDSGNVAAGNFTYA